MKLFRNTRELFWVLSRKANSYTRIGFQHPRGAALKGIWLHRIAFLLLMLASSLMLNLLSTDAVAAPPPIALESVATDLENPIAITNAGDGSGRLFITLQCGKIMIYDGTQVLPTPFLDISSFVSCGGEQGLLSVAFHPKYVNNGFFYVNYTDTDGDTVIARYSVSGNPNIANPNSAFILLTVAQPFDNHNGGQLQFDPDGYLYIGMGDGGGAGDTQNNSQNLNTLLGKMLRIDVDSGDDFPGDPNRNYAIPLDNPFVGIAGLDEIWALGLRNPWRFSFDFLTGDLFIGDVGQGSREEIDFQPASSTGGENYGWRCYEGNNAFNLTGCGPASGYDFPILEYTHSLGCSVTGGYRYRGSQFQELNGTYLYGDFCSGIIWGATQNGSSWTTTQLLDTKLLISAFGEGEDGEIYLAHYSSPDGAIYHIVNANGSATSDLSVSKSDSPDPVTVGNNLTYTITITNNGPNIATGVILTDTLPSSVTFVSATASQGSCSRNGGVVTCNLGNLANSAKDTITIVVRRSTPGGISNTATATANEPDPNTANNTDTEATTVVSQTSRTFRLSVFVTGSGTVMSTPSGIGCPGDCAENYANGTRVTVNAKPASGWRFVGWSGSCRGTGACVANMTINRSVMATFSRQRGLPVLPPR